jgi:chloramphenicol 3-O-phosphotransferase
MAPRDILYNDFNNQMSIALNILRETALLYSNNGHGVIIDDVVLDLPNDSCKEYKYAAMPQKNGSLYLYAKKLYDYPTMFVHVVCPIEELERREITRGDRYIGQSRLNLMHEYTNIPYDFVVNTFLESTETCANRVIDLLRNPESWTALKEIRKKFEAECMVWV